MEQRAKRVGRSSDLQSARKPAGQTVIERAMDVLRNGILRGRYAPGQRLVEADLIHELQISRGSVREVLRRLETDGLVAIEAYRGAVVAPLSRDSLHNAFDVREVIEGLAARLAAERFATGEFPAAATEKKLRDCAKTGSGDKDDYMDRNTRFHTFIAELSGNPYLLPVLEQMQVPARRSHFPTVMDRAAMDASMKEHVDVVDAICSGDPARAEKAMRRHVRRTAKLSERLPDYLFAGSAD
jgi:DNA-binding GntR family transcriptional regulator